MLGVLSRNLVQPMALASIPELIAEVRAGRMVIVVDDEDRENEGDLIMAAGSVRPEDINFMAREARGLICLSLTRGRCERLGLQLMVSDNRTPYQTAFTVSIEAASGVTTGISAFDRAHTIRTAVADTAQAVDLRQPGHIFPLMSQAGGVLVRAGHTEAAADLACLAGFEPAGVLVEIMDDDGRMARRPQLEVFAQKHGLKMGSIADLIRYRLETEHSIERVSQREVMTPAGAFQLVEYRDHIERATHLALVHGQIQTDQPTLVRVQGVDVLRDSLGISGEGLSASEALQLLRAEAAGVLVLLNSDHPESATLARPATPLGAWRKNGIGAQILADLGVRQLRVLGTARRYVGLEAFGLTQVD
jgi:3,4-dihydroxy 2-butanone 4-phosphate synthase/GTP cyclohydrolase II